MTYQGKISNGLLSLVAIFVCQTGSAAILTGTINNWEEFESVQVIGDGTNSVTLFWSIARDDEGYFYGNLQTGDSDVAYAEGISDVSQIVDASVFDFRESGIGPFCDADCATNGVGDFIVARNINTGYYGVLRIDDIVVIDLFETEAYVNATWWFQTDGTGDFSSVPLPAGLPLLFSGAAALACFGPRRSQTSTRK